MYPTRISGILVECSTENTGSATVGKTAINRKAFPSLNEFDDSLQAAVAILELLRKADMLSIYTGDRKLFISLLQSILDGSNCVQLLMAAVQTVGSFLLKGNKSGLTSKERNNLLWKIASFDFNSLPDVTSQPLADLVSIYMIKLCEQPDQAGSQDQSLSEKDEVTIYRSIQSCLITANGQLRRSLLNLYMRRQQSSKACSLASTLRHFFYSDFEGVGGRFWLVVFLEILLDICIVKSPKDTTIQGYAQTRRLPSPRLREASAKLEANEQVKASYEKYGSMHSAVMSDLSNGGSKLRDALCLLAHGDSSVCQSLCQSLLPGVWSSIPNNSAKLELVPAIEAFLSRPFYAQSFKTKEGCKEALPVNAVKALLSSLALFDPLPFVSIDLLVYVAENYNCWFETLSILERQYLVLSSSRLSKTGNIECEKVLLAMRRCYRQLGETSIWTSLALESCTVPGSQRAASLDIYGKVDQALDEYTNLMRLVETGETSTNEFEMNFWEEQWVKLQREECQLGVVSEYASQTNNAPLMLECAWKERNWDKVRALCASSPVIAVIETGDPSLKMVETLSAVAEGKLSDVENLHAQSSQLCLYKWRLLPNLTSGSLAHASLLHNFHRLVEIRESGQIMVETNNHSNGRTLPDLKNLLNAWRHRLPNDEEDLTLWDEIFFWRAHMFNAITSNFQWTEPGALTALHDKPWTTIRMSTVARKQGLRNTALLLLNRLTDNQSMDVSDAYLKLREQILLLNNPDSERERTGGLNLINTTNLSYFDDAQKSELFRLKAIFLASLRRTSKSNQAYCHSVQICPTHSKSWISWGGLCSSLGAMTEKQADQAKVSGNSEEAAKSEKEKTKRVAQYLAQAMGCYLEAVQVDPSEKTRIHLPKCLWMLTKDGPSPGVLCQTLEGRGISLPPFVWLPWIPQLLSGLCRSEGLTIRNLLSRVVKAYPQAVYYSLRAFYLERRDVERSKTGGSSAQQQHQQHMGSVAYAEEMMSTLRRSHASLWSSLEAILEELIVRFRPSYEEELLATISALLERAESHAEKQSLPDEKRADDEEAMVVSWSKTLSRIAAKFFSQQPENTSSSSRRDERRIKTAEFKRKYKEDFERDFQVGDDSTSESAESDKPQFRLAQYIEKLTQWKEKLETQVSRSPMTLPLISSSRALGMFVGTQPDLWPGACDTRHSSSNLGERFGGDDDLGIRNLSSASSSATIAMRAAVNAAKLAASGAAREGIGGEVGGGSSAIEIPGQYVPNTSASDLKPSPELHAKLVRFEPFIQVLRRSDQLVRRCGMIGSDGRTYRYLLQFAIPYWTRTDERTAQVHYVLDQFLRKNMVASRNHLSIQPTAAIPVAQRLRMCRDFDSRLSLDDVLRRSYDAEGKDTKEIASYFLQQITSKLKDKVSSDASEAERAEAEREVRLEVYRDICSTKVEKRMLLRYLLKAFKDQEGFYLFRRAFSVQLAANSLLQYVFSVAERTPQRVVIQQSNGRVMSPDFRVSYSNQGFIEGHAVPYRLTPNIETVLGEHYLQGEFVQVMTMIAGAVKDHRDEFDPILRLLMRDDILAWYSKSMAKTDSKTQELERQLIERVAKNVHTLQSRISECSPSNKPSDTKPPDARTKALLISATDPAKLCMMPASYHPWL
jgi:transformation/transcription domain-associated protein